MMLVPSTLDCKKTRSFRRGRRAPSLRRVRPLPANVAEQRRGNIVRPLTYRQQREEGLFIQIRPPRLVTALNSNRGWHSVRNETSVLLSHVPHKEVTSSLFTCGEAEQV